MKIQRLTRVKLTLGAFVRLVSVFLDLHGAEEQDLFVKAISRNLIFKMCQVPPSFDPIATPSISGYPSNCSKSDMLDKFFMESYIGTDYLVTATRRNLTFYKTHPFKGALV